MSKPKFDDTTTKTLEVLGSIPGLYDRIASLERELAAAAVTIEVHRAERDADRAAIRALRAELASSLDGGAPEVVYRSLRPHAPAIARATQKTGEEGK